MDKKYAKKTLEMFLSFPLNTGKPVLEHFATLPGASVHLDGGKNNFVYVPGTREDRVLLVAHVDTVWDEMYCKKFYEQKPICRWGVYKGTDKECGIGADDRAGCAILWLLKDSGHSLLVVDGEEHGQIGSNHIKTEYPEIFDELNSHSYMIQFDRRNNNDYKVYSLPVSDDFIAFVEKSTCFYDAGRNARTDIVTLCRDICAVNLSIGYYDEHTPRETLRFNHWFKTLTLAEKILAEGQKRYLLNN